LTKKLESLTFRAEEKPPLEVEMEREAAEDVIDEITTTTTKITTTTPEKVVNPLTKLQLENELLRKENDALKKEIRDLKKISRGSSFNGGIQLEASDPKKWASPEAIAWLEKEGYGGLMSLAKEHRWDGPIIYGLYQSRRDSASFSADCTKLGIPAGVIQIKLKGSLTILFGQNG
jgi:hypothetical protein